MVKRILDLFSGAGGAAMGYHKVFPDAEIVGVDINPQPNYPFKFVKGDALTYPTEGFDLIHASPPCQAYTTMSAKHRGKGTAADQHQELIPQVRDRLKQSGAHWVLENVPGARRDMIAPTVLQGGQFNLGVHRPRLFDSSFPIEQLPPTKAKDPVGVYGKLDGRRLYTRSDGSELRAAKGIKAGREAMGIDWMNDKELAESIPPAYTMHIGMSLKSHIAGGS